MPSASEAELQVTAKQPQGEHDGHADADQCPKPRVVCIVNTADYSTTQLHCDMASCIVRDLRQCAAAHFGVAQECFDLVHNSGDEGHITRSALAVVWGNLVRDKTADGGPARLQLNCAEVLRTAGGLEKLLEGLRELPPALSEAVAVAQLVRAAVAELVVQPLAGQHTEVSKQDLRQLLEGLDVRPRLADSAIDALFDAAGCTAMRLTVEQCCTVLGEDGCEALVAERSATTVADLVAAAKGWESRRRRAPPGTDSPPKRRASIANILWNREKEGAQSPRRRSRTFGDRNPASPSSPFSAFSGLSPASPQKQTVKAFRAIQSAGQGLADKEGGEKNKSGAEKTAADKDDQGGCCELCEELRAELARANRKARLREEQLRRWLELAKASVDAAMVGTAIAAEVPGSPRGGAETTLGADLPLRLRVAELEDALADAQSACEDALRRLADGRAKAEQREQEMTELRAQAQSLQVELAAARDSEEWLGAARKENEADEVRRVMERDLGRLREALKGKQEALAASEQREQAALIDAACLAKAHRQRDVLRQRFGELLARYEEQTEMVLVLLAEADSRGRVARVPHPMAVEASFTAGGAAPAGMPGWRYEPYNKTKQ
eukprot:TRINITY_DN2932_c0_g2_i3.p1 TRINITY_DN2932_c0_g2~~TRINITY_DN2932_c0_g2_i3.p1  ORF type:complete len:635 (+),score=174.20 TRINITY_DN2932_c0_g2_i3:73-1905(+)